jgi:hypothetical protein
MPGRVGYLPVSWDRATALAGAKAVEQIALPLRQLVAAGVGQGVEHLDPVAD